MARAELHSAFAIDSELYRASRVDPTLFDPVVRVDGGLPGVARPFTVIRAYQGPQGAYAEHFVLRDRDGNERARSIVRRIRVRGEMFEDGFTTELREVLVTSADEHRVAFYVNDEEVGEIPVFIEAGQGGDPATAAEETLRKALQKGTVVWLTVPQPGGGEHTQAVWFVFDSGKVYVLHGPREQQVPGLTAASQVTITARSKDMRSQVSRLPADARVVPADDPLFDKVAHTGLGKRLNLHDGDGALERWRTTCTLVELTPRVRARAGDDGAPATAAAAAEAPGPEGDGQAAAVPAQEDIHVEAQIDQAVYDQLVAEGKSDRVARAKAKAAYVRAEKARIRAERETASP